MAFKCRICKSKLLATNAFTEQLDSSVVSTICGHLYHLNCLNASITNQKLSHAMTGTGPFRQYCPSSFCGAGIEENGIIEICTSTPQSPNEDLSEDHDDSSNDDLEVKFRKKFQIVTAEKERLATSLEKMERDNENYHEAMDHIKIECEEINSLLIDDAMIKKGDRVFWITKEGTFVPGKILEMRKTSNSHLSASTSNNPYAIIKLDRRTKLQGLGPERETAIVSVNELLTFKSFFKECFQEFRHKLRNILLETNEKMTKDERQKLQKSKFRESCLRLSIDSAAERPDERLLTSHESVDSIPIDSLHAYRSEQESSKRSTKINRAKTMGYGTARPRPRIIQEKSRSVSWNNSKNSLLSEGSELFCESDSPVMQSPIFSIGIPDDEASTDQSTSDFITVGERVIWYDTHSTNPQIGKVAAVLQYTPCAIVKFDKLPNETQIYQFRTVPLVQLFPYALACPEEKFRIAEAYGNIDDFMQEHPEMFETDEFNYEIEPLDDEEYFSTSSAEDISFTLQNMESSC